MQQERRAVWTCHIAQSCYSSRLRRRQRVLLAAAAAQTSRAASPAASSGRLAAHQLDTRRMCENAGSGTHTCAESPRIAQLGPGLPSTAVNDKPRAPVAGRMPCPCRRCGCHNSIAQARPAVQRCAPPGAAISRAQCTRVHCSNVAHSSCTPTRLARRAFRSATRRRTAATCRRPSTCQSRLHVRRALRRSASCSLLHESAGRGASTRGRRGARRANIARTIQRVCSRQRVCRRKREQHECKHALSRATQSA